MESNAGLLSYAAEVLASAGGIGVVIALLFFVCLGVGLERLVFWVQLWRPRLLLGRSKRDGREERISGVEELIRAGRFAEAGGEAERSGNAALSFMGRALMRLRHPDTWASTRDAVLSESLGASLTHGRGFLITAIQCFGLLGMLGTCKGLYAQLSTFGTSIAQGGSIDGVMSGMGEAFTTTLVGLGAAILTTVIYFLNEAAISRFQREVRWCDSRIRAALTEHAQGCEARVPAGSIPRPDVATVREAEDGSVQAMPAGRPALVHSSPQS